MFCCSYEKKKIAACFSRAANTYDGACVLQKQVGWKLLTLMNKDYNKRYDSNCILDVGSGTGYFSELLAASHSPAEVVSVDISNAMLKIASKRPLRKGMLLVNADFDSIPIKNYSIDSIYSNMAFQWSLNLSNTLLEMRRLLKPNGLLSFSMPILGSLCELIHSLKRINRKMRTNQFISSAALSNIIEQVGFNDFDISIGEHIIHYDNVYDLLLSLKKTGANRIKYNDPKFCGKDYFDLLSKVYQKDSNHYHGVKATYRIAYVIAR